MAVPLYFYHPDMQEALLQRAEKSGAEIRRAARVESVTAGDVPAVEFLHAGSNHRATAGVVVGADGRGSAVRRAAGFELRRDPEHLMIAGTLLDGSGVPDDGVDAALGEGSMMLMAPQGRGPVRTYFVYPRAAGLRPLSGGAHAGEFLAACRSTGAPDEWFSEARVAGPLAQFSGADQWVDHPARNGIVLIGDAAAASDPSWGSGLSLTLLDAGTAVNAAQFVTRQGPTRRDAPRGRPTGAGGP